MSDQLPQTRQIIIENRVYTITFVDDNGYHFIPGAEVLPHVGSDTPRPFNPEKFMGVDDSKTKAMEATLNHMAKIPRVMPQINDKQILWLKELLEDAGQGSNYSFNDVRNMFMRAGGR